MWIREGRQWGKPIKHEIKVLIRGSGHRKEKMMGKNDMTKEKTQ